MANRIARLRRALRNIARPTNAPAALALVVIVGAGVYGELQNRKIHEQSERASVSSAVSLLRARLEGNINGDIELVRGLVAAISTEPAMTQERFADLASRLLTEKSQIRNIAGAPDMVVSMIYPLAGNETVLGMDYRTNARQRESAMRARDTQALVLAGPVDLVQGGTGIIGRFPVFYSEAGRRSFWGIVSAVLDLEHLYRDSGLLAADLPVEIAIMGRDGMGTAGSLFYGRGELFSENPVKADVRLPSGSWRIAAVPKGGWAAMPPNTWTLRLLMFIGGALILVPIVLAGRLIDQRTGNVAELRRREVELGRLSRRLGLALETSRFGVWEMNLDNGELLWDDRMNELYGYPQDGALRGYSHWARRLHPDDLHKTEADFAVAVASKGSYNSDYRIVCDDGSVRHIRAIGRVHHQPGQPTRIIGVNWDMSADVALNESLKAAKQLSEARNAELESAKARIEFNALHDSLTGLPNRRYLDELLTRHVAEPNQDERLGLLHIDLDRFKQINDTLGHAAGDAMLMHAASVLKANLRPDDFVARVGGDEFVVLCRVEELSEQAMQQHLARVAERIIQEMQQPVSYEGHECRFGVSIGIACQSPTQASPERLLVNADIALYRAKSSGRNRHQFFNDDLQAEIVNTKRIADDILSGLERNEFVPYYQPQFDAASHAVIGVEALARWLHPTAGVLAPAYFMKIAEELNVVAAIDRMILEQTLRDFGDWEAAGVGVPMASVNVSARRLHDDQLIRSLRDLDIRPGTIAFELVESIFLDENDELVTWNVEQIKSLGIHIEIDDFGTGHASIVSLLKLRPHRLKIDRQLVTPILQSRGQRQLVGSIIEIGRSLGVEVLAEGVETMEHASALRTLGCHALQGYAFAKAMCSDDLKVFLADRKLRRAS